MYLSVYKTASYMLTNEFTVDFAVLLHLLVET